MRKNRYNWVKQLLVAALPTLIAGCSVFNTHQDQMILPKTVDSQEQIIHYLSSNKENEGTAKIINELAMEYASSHPNVKYEFENVGGTDLTQKVQLLAASNDLPALFSFESGKALEDVVRGGQVLDIEKAFKDLNIYDKLNPAAVRLLKEQIGVDGLYALPLEMNIEGFWYNKKMFEDNNLREPKTWDEMLEDAEILKKQGIQPFSVAGKEKWPITRLINGYVIRKYGSDVMNRVSKRELKVTDSGFLEAAQTVKDMAEKGYFGQAVNTIDNDTAVDIFLQGKAAMFYIGSWELRDFNNEKRNQIGVENIGLFNIPLVKDGKGTLNDWSMNTGLTTSFSKAAYNQTIGEFVKEIFSQYADRSMSELGIITGFEVNRMPGNVPHLTQFVQNKMDTAQNGVLWFEAFFNAKTQSVAWDNAQFLISTSYYTAQDYMNKLQIALDEQNRAN